MSDNKLLKDKICLVTGASRGIGRAIAERFAEEQAIVYANARNSGSIDAWAEECSSKFGTLVKPVYFDIKDYPDVKKCLVEIHKKHKQVDVLVNNAGMVSYEFLSMIDFNKLRDMFEINVISMIHLIQLASRIMSRKKQGSIINVSSIVGKQGSKGQLGYSATKGAVISLTKSAAKELADLNIRVNAIAPGMVDTERFRSVFNEHFNERISDIGMGRLASPDEVADSCVFLASDLSTYISGQILGIDGCTSL